MYITRYLIFMHSFMVSQDNNRIVVCRNQPADPPLPCHHFMYNLDYFLCPFSQILINIVGGAI